jgi:transforming growth factor-beta-induced protein
MAANPNLAAMTKNATFVTDLLEYHIATGVFPSANFIMTPQFASTAYQVPSVRGTRPQMLELAKVNSDALVISGFKQVSRVQQADIFFNGGVMHVIDTVLTEPESPSVTALDTGLTSLAGALVKTNMVGGVDTLQDVTVFAPSNAAFGAVGNVVESANNELLSEVLEYHVVSGVVATSAELMRMAMAGGGTTTLRTLQGSSVIIREEGGSLFANNARIKVADVLTSNGVVHVIDK